MPASARVARVCEGSLYGGPCRRLLTACRRLLTGERDGASVIVIPLAGLESACGFELERERVKRALGGRQCNSSSKTLAIASLRRCSTAGSFKALWREIRCTLIAGIQLLTIPGELQSP